MQLFFLVVSLTAVSFGGGNPMLAGLERELVPSGVISPTDFAAAVAMGQSTPGPLAAFTTAIGRAALGWPGAVAATFGLIVISLAVVALIRHLPRAWFQSPVLRGGLEAVGPYTVAAVFFLAYRTVLSGHLEAWAGPVAIMGLVAAGRLFRLPTAALMLGAVALGMVLQGSAWAAW